MSSTTPIGLMHGSRDSNESRSLTAEDAKDAEGRGRQTNTDETRTIAGGVNGPPGRIANHAVSPQHTPAIVRRPLVVAGGVWGRWHLCALPSGCGVDDHRQIMGGLPRFPCRCCRDCLPAVRSAQCPRSRSQGSVQQQSTPDRLGVIQLRKGQRMLPAGIYRRQDRPADA